MVVKLKGAAMDFHSEKKGLYRYGHDKVNGRGHWIQEGKKEIHAIWHDIEFGGWNIAPIEDMGSTTAGIYSNASIDPLQATAWKYAENGKYIVSKDIVVLPATKAMSDSDSIDEEIDSDNSNDSSDNDIEFENAGDSEYSSDDEFLIQLKKSLLKLLSFAVVVPNILK